MKVYTIQVNSVVDPVVLTSIKSVCDLYDLNYSTTTKKIAKQEGYRSYFRQGFSIITVTTCELQRIKGRENNGKKKRP